MSLSFKCMLALLVLIPRVSAASLRILSPLTTDILHADTSIDIVVGLENAQGPLAESVALEIHWRAFKSETYTPAPAPDCNKTSSSHSDEGPAENGCAQIIMPDIDDNEWQVSEMFTNFSNNSCVFKASFITGQFEFWVKARVLGVYISATVVLTLYPKTLYLAGLYDRDDPFYTWMEPATQLIVDSINTDPTILPYTTVALLSRTNT